MPTVHLVDGTDELSRSWFALPRSIRRVQDGRGGRRGSARAVPAGRAGEPSAGDRDLAHDRARGRRRPGHRRRAPSRGALVGDAADGIPGIKRWGAKSAATLLTRYGHLEDIPADPDAWNVKVRGAASLARELADQAADARLYEPLATPRTDADIDASLAARAWHGPDRELLTSLCEEIGETPSVLKLDAEPG